MKQYTVEEFLEACEWLRRNPYALDEFDEHIPDGDCNGHEVRASRVALASVVIDGKQINLGVVNDNYPNGHITHCVRGKTLTGPEYVRHILLARYKVSFFFVNPRGELRQDEFNGDGKGFTFNDAMAIVNDLRQRENHSHVYAEAMF